MWDTAGGLALFGITPLKPLGESVFNGTYSIFRNHRVISLLLLLTSIVLVLVSFSHSYPILTPIFAFAVALLMILFLKPITGVYIWLFLFPFQTIYFAVSVYWHTHIHETHFVELFAPIILPVLLVKALQGRSEPSLRAPVPAEFKWVYFFSAAFICWSLISLLISPLPAEITINWWVLICNFPLCAFLILNLDEYDKFVRLIIFFCIVAAISSIIAIYSNYHEYNRSICLPTLIHSR